jgi:cytoskeletal protein CcmA (bactofilin family)
LALTAGYGGGGASWETEELKRVFADNGTIKLSARHDAGWLKVKSTGCFRNDTVFIEGILGQSAPEASGNALTIGHSANDVVVGDMASLSGNVGTTGGRIITRNKGIFNGKIVRAKPPDFSDGIIEKEFSVFRDFPKSGHHGDDIVAVKPSDLDGMLRSSEAGEMRLCVDGPIAFGSDYNGSVKLDLYVDGNLRFEKSCRISGLKGYVQGTVTIKDSAQLECCSIIASGSVRIGDKAVVRGTIASAETLAIGGAATIAYPSLLYLSRTRCNLTNNQILTVQDDADVHGVVATGNFNDNSFSPRIVSGLRSRIEGLVVSPGAMTPYGTIKGSVLTDRFAYKSERIVYENWLREVSISAEDLSLMTIPLLFPKEAVFRYVRITPIVGGLL